MIRKLTGQSKAEEMDEDDKDEGGGGSERAGGQQHQQHTTTLPRRPPCLIWVTRGQGHLDSPRRAPGKERRVRRGSRLTSR